MDVILVASRAPDKDARKHEGLNIIRQALLENGITPKLKYISDFNPKTLEKDSIIGLSAYYESLDEVIKKADEIKKTGNHFLILGGPGTYHKGTNKEILNTGVFDALNMGHATPFIEFVKSVSQNTSLPLEQIAVNKGLATKDYQIFTEGAFPDLETYPLKSYNRRGKEAINIPPMRKCPNKCDYCIESRTSVPDLTDKIMDAIIAYQKSEKINVVSFSSPTFNKANIADAKKILSVIEGRPETIFYADSYQIAQNTKAILKQLDEFNTTSVYIGLNAIDNYSAEYVGRRIGNKIRTNIEDEKSAIIRFLKAKRDVSEQEDYTISILISKAENQNRFAEIIKYLDKLVSISLNSDKRIAVQIIQTIPYPGTAFAHNHGNDYQFSSKKEFSIDGTTKKCNYSKKSVEFLRRSFMGTYHLALAESSIQSLVGLNSILLAYEHVYQGKMKTIFSQNKQYVECMKGEKEFILHPELVDKGKPEDSNLK